MADADITIKDGANVDRKVDTRTVGAGTDEHREVVVLGSPTTTATIELTSDGRLPVKTDYSATPVVVSVVPATTSSTLVAADATNGRIHVQLYNDTDQIVYVRLGTEAAVIAPVGAAGGFSFEMPPGSFYESTRNYVGAMTCIVPATPTGAVRVTTY